MQSADAIPLALVRPSAPYAARVLENRDLTPGSASDVRHLVLDLGDSGLRYLEGQSVGVHPPGLGPDGKPHRLRLYSIASARSGDDGTGRTLSLCIKRVIYDDPVSGEPIRGVASNHANDLAPGETVLVSGPIGKHFLMPAVPDVPLLMVATGTGIAPFRGFLAHRKTLPTRGPALLVFGARTTSELLYRSELEGLLTEPGDQVQYAVSREQKNARGGSMYVGDRLIELADTIWPLLSRNLHVYLCGLKGMEAGIELSMEEIASSHGQRWADIRQALVAEKRWRVDTY